jgi:hypothetical protein
VKPTLGITIAVSIAVIAQLAIASAAAVPTSATFRPCSTPGSEPIPTFILVGPKGELHFMPWFLELGSRPINGIPLIDSIELVPAKGIVVVIDHPRWTVTPRVTDVPIPADTPPFDTSVLLPKLAKSTNYRVVLKWNNNIAPNDCPIKLRETIGAFTTGT